MSDVEMGINWRATQRRQQKSLDRIVDLHDSMMNIVSASCLERIEELLKVQVEQNTALLAQNEALIAHNEWVRTQAGYHTQEDE